MTAAPTVAVFAAAAHTLRPLGPFDLERTRDFVGRRDPITRHTPGPDEPLRLTAPLDGDQRPVAFPPCSPGSTTATPTTRSTT